MCLPLSVTDCNFDGVAIGVYELVRHDLKPGLFSQLEYAVQQGFSSRLNMDYPKPIGMWQCEFGPAQRGMAELGYCTPSFLISRPRIEVATSILNSRIPCIIAEVAKLD